MKSPKLFGTSRYFMLAVVVLSLFAVAMSARSKKGGVIIEKEYILIPRVTSLSEQDLKDLNNVLKQYDKDIYGLYKIATYKKGKRDPKTMGCQQLAKATEQIAEKATADAKEKGLSDVAIQISAPLEARSPSKASPSREDPSPTPSIGPVVACNNPLSNRGKARELLTKVTPILKKYSGQ